MCGECVYHLEKLQKLFKLVKIRCSYNIIDSKLPRFWWTTG